MAELSDCIISGSDMNQLKSLLSQVLSICRKYGWELSSFEETVTADTKKYINDRPAEVEYTGCEMVTVSQAAELIFEHYGITDEHPMTMNNFITNRLKLRGYVTYHQSIHGRVYSLTDLADTAEWLEVPTLYHKDHSKEFSSQYMFFHKDKIPVMLKDLWIANKPAFEKSLAGYKDFIEKAKRGQ